MKNIDSPFSQLYTKDKSYDTGYRCGYADGARDTHAEYKVLLEKIDKLAKQLKE